MRSIRTCNAHRARTQRRNAERLAWNKEEDQRINFMIRDVLQMRPTSFNRDQFADRLRPMAASTGRAGG